jgi:hypothetical protein
MSPTSRHDLHGGDPALLLEEIGDGIGVVDRAGELLWMNHRLEALAPESMRRFCEACRDLLSELAEDGTDRRTHLRTFRSGDRTWEIAITPLVRAGSHGPADRAVGVLHDVTARQAIVERVEAIDATGGDLIALDAKSLGPLNVAERLRLIEGKIVTGLEKLFGGDHGYADLVPAMQKVVQAAGRVLRTPEDRGWLWLLDDRYLQRDVAALLPTSWGLNRPGVGGA